MSNCQPELPFIPIADPNRGESVLPTRLAPPPNPGHVYDSVLKLDNVRSEHYSTVFTCIANNSFGTDATDIRLVAPGKPDPPSEVLVMCRISFVEIFGCLFGAF